MFSTSTPQIARARRAMREDGWLACISLRSALALALVVVAGLGQETATPRGAVLEQDCGAYSAGVALSLLNVASPGFDELKKELGIGASGLCSMADIQRVLGQHGVRATARPIEAPSADQIAIVARRHPAGGDNPAHFLVIRGTGGDRVDYFDPPMFAGGSYWPKFKGDLLPAMLLCEVPPRMTWGRGISLALLAMGALGLAWQFRHLRLRPAVVAAVAAVTVALGGCRPGHTGGLRFEPGLDITVDTKLIGRQKYDITVVNESPSPVKFDRVLASCTCASYVFHTDKPLEPGERRVCTLDVEVANTPRTILVFFRQDDGKLTTVTVHLPAARVQGLELAGSIDLGDIPPGVESSRKVLLHFTDGARALAGPSATIGPISWVVERAGTLVIRTDGRTEIPVAELPTATMAEVVVKPFGLGPGSAAITAYVGQTSLDTVVRWNVVQPLGVTPDVVRLARTVDHGWSGEFTVDVPEGAEIVAVSADGQGVVVNANDVTGRTRKYSIAAPDAWVAKSGVGEIHFDVKVKASSPTRFAVPFVAEPQ